MKRLYFIILLRFMIFPCNTVLAQNIQAYGTGHDTGSKTFENSNYINIFDPLFYTEFLTDHNANRIIASEQKEYHLRGHDTPYRSQGYNIQPYTQGIQEQIQTPKNNDGYKMQEKTLQKKVSEIKLQRANYGTDSNSQNHTQGASNADSKSNFTSDNHHHHGPNGELIIHDRHHNVINTENNTSATPTADQQSNKNDVSDSFLSKSHDNQKMWLKKQTQNNKVNHHYLRYIIDQVSRPVDYQNRGNAADFNFLRYIVDQASRPVSSHYQDRGNVVNFDFLRYIVDQASRPVNSHSQDRGNGENFNFLRYIVDQASRPVNAIYQNRESNFLNLFRYIELLSGYDALDGIQDYIWLL